MTLGDQVATLQQVFTGEPGGVVVPLRRHGASVLLQAHLCRKDKAAAVDRVDAITANSAFFQGATQIMNGSGQALIADLDRLPDFQGQLFSFD